MPKHLALGLACLSLALLSACSSSPEPTSDVAPPPTLKVGAIPDQDPEKLQRLHAKLTAYLTQKLGVPVSYKPVTDYAAAVSAFRVGDLDLVWFGGLTGVQAQLQVPKAQAIAQRDIDAQFTSVFIAHESAQLTTVSNPNELKTLTGKRITFGSESSTSGRLMPQYFLQENGVDLKDFKAVGFSGSHDSTLNVVSSGSYEVGALNSQVWRDRVEQGKVDLNKVKVIWETPPYFDYHWVLHPNVETTYGSEFPDKVKVALLSLDSTAPAQKEILDLFGAKKFIATENENYAQIEAIGRKIGKIK